MGFETLKLKELAIKDDRNHESIPMGFETMQKKQHLQRAQPIMRASLWDLKHKLNKQFKNV